MGYAFFVTIKGKKQGAFKGEGEKENEKDKILGLKFSYELKSPRDVSTGQASGKRQHSAITITKEWGAATPQIFEALTTNEVLTEVKIEFRKTNANGEEYIYHRVTLTDASVSALRQFTSDPLAAAEASSAKHGASADNKEMEDVSFTFHKIEIENLDGKTMSQDDWSTN